MLGPWIKAKWKWSNRGWQEWTSTFYPSPLLVQILPTSCVHLQQIQICLQFKNDGASLVAQMVKNLPAVQRSRFDPWVRKIAWRRKWQPTQVFLPGKSHGQRSLVGYSHKESDMTEWLVMYACIHNIIQVCKKCYTNEHSNKLKLSVRRKGDRNWKRVMITLCFQ